MTNNYNVINVHIMNIHDSTSNNYKITLLDKNIQIYNHEEMSIVIIS